MRLLPFQMFFLRFIARGGSAVAQPLAVWLWCWCGKLVFLNQRHNHSGMSTKCERTVSGVFHVFFYMTRAAWQHKTQNKYVVHEYSSTLWNVLRYVVERTAVKLYNVLRSCRTTYCSQAVRRTDSIIAYHAMSVVPIDCIFVAVELHQFRHTDLFHSKAQQNT